MNVGDLFQRLSFGELSNLAIGMEGAGSIEELQQNKVVSYANAVLTALDTRFADKSHFVKLWLDGSTQRYRLSQEHLISNMAPGNTALRYIEDTPDDPFRPKVIRILSAKAVIPDDYEQRFPDLAPYRTTLGQSPKREPFGRIDILTHDEILVPRPIQDEYVEVEYAAGHARLTLPANELEPIDIAPSLEEALEAGVAARVFGAIGGEANLVRVQMLKGQYEEACQRVELMDLTHAAAGTDFDRLHDAGFV